MLYSQNTILTQKFLSYIPLQWIYIFIISKNLLKIPMLEQIQESALELI